MLHASSQQTQRQCRRIATLLAGVGLLWPAAAGAGLVEEAGSPIAVGQEPFWTAAADLNGDGLPDLAVANDASTEQAGSVSVLLRQSLGGFAAEGPAIPVGSRPGSVAAADVNGDGRTDLATANYFSGNVTVLLRKADNSGFEEENGSPIAVATSPHSIATGDFNGDGRIDLAMPSFALSTVDILLRKADNSGFEAEAAVPVGPNPTQIAVADFNGDARADIASADHNGNTVTVLLRKSDNSGFAAEADPVGVGVAPVAPVARDFDGDGRPDLAVTNEGSDSVTVLLRQADGGFVEAPGSPHPAGDGAYGLAAGDFDGDGITDLAATAYVANSVSVLLGTGTGAFAHAAYSPLPTAKGPLVLAAADFDGNGRDDLAIPNNATQTVTVRRNVVDPEPAPLPVAPAGCTPPSAGRVALWRGEDSARDSAGSHDGSLENGGGYRDGLIGRAFSLTGSDDYVHVAGRPDLNITGDLTFDAWIQLDGETLDGDRVIVAKTSADDSAVTYAFWIEGDAPSTSSAAPLRFAGGPRNDPATVVTSDDLAWESGAWYHVTVVRSGTTVTFFRDGQPVGQATIGGSPASTADMPVNLGGSVYDASVLNPLKGGLDEPELWNRALSAAEIAELHATPRGLCFTPDTTLTVTPPALTNDSTPTFEFSSPTAGATFACEIDDGGFEPCTSPHTTAPLTDGKHRFRVRAITAATSRRRATRATRAADPDPAEFDFEVDTTPPDTRITEGPDDGATVASPATFAFTSTEAGSRFTCLRTSDIGTEYEDTVSFACDIGRASLSLSEGNWTFRVRATDPAGNVDLSPARRTFRILDPPRNTALPAIRPVQVGSSLYRCDPGSWTGRDATIPYVFEWFRVIRSAGDKVDYSKKATGEYYRAAAETQGELVSASWEFVCVATAANAVATVPALSLSRTLIPEYDPLTSAPYGNVGIRGIDVFQVVQPNSGAAMYGFNPADIWPQSNGTGSQNVDYWRSTPFPSNLGGGTPTDWLFDGSMVDSNPQDVPYDGVTLDTDKVTYAIVYVNVLGGEPLYDDQGLQVELAATSRGEPIPNSPRAIYATKKNPPPTNTRFVTAAQRGSRDHGIRMKLPPEWLRVADLNLTATVGFAPGAGVAPGLRQCDSDPRCSEDDTFRLRRVKVAFGADRPAQLIIQPVRMSSRANQTFPRIEDLLPDAKHVFPGGSRIRMNQYFADLDISAAVKPPADGPCAMTFTRGCQAGAVMTILNKWVSDYPPRPPWPGGGYVQRYDLALGVHDYRLPDGTREPGYAWGGTIEYVRTGPAAPGSTDWDGNGPRATITAVDRPLTAGAHELGHMLSMPHIADCPAGKDGYGVQVWPPDRAGRLQSTKFDTRAPGTTLVVDDDQPTSFDTPATATTPFVRRQFRTTQLFDLMSYCYTTDEAAPAINSGDAWLSARNWNHAYGALRQMARYVGSENRPFIVGAGAARAATARASARTAAGAGAFAVGSVSAEGGVISAITPADGDDAIPAPVAGARLRLRSLDRAGNVIADAGVGVQVPSDVPSAQGGAFVGPVPAAAATVELVQDGRVLHRLARTAAPRLRLIAPRRGTRAGRSLEVRWSASDPDSRSLDVTIDFTHDGGRSWKNVFNGRSTGRALIPGQLLVASRAARVRVAVSDGFNEATALSAPFRAAGRAPVVTLERPFEHERLTTTGRSLLIATALDDRGAPMGGRAITWYAGKRRLGTGDRLYAKLPAGRYTLRAVATDRLGRTASAGRPVRITVEPLRLVTLTAPRTVKRAARTATVTVRTAEPATFSIAGRRYRVGPRARRIVVALPKRPARGIVRLPCSLEAPGRTTLKRRVTIFRG